MTSKIPLLLALLCLIALSATAQSSAPCTFCFGVSEMQTPPEIVVPMVIHGDEGFLEDVESRFDGLSKAQLAEVHLHLDFPISPEDTIDSIEQRIEVLTGWLGRMGRIASIGIGWDASSGDLHAFLVKRLSIRLQGAGVADSITLEPGSVDALARFYELQAGPYIDAVWVPTGDLEAFASWLIENDPIRKIFTIITTNDPNPLYSLSTEIGRGATRAFLDGATAAQARSIAEWNQEVTGDFSWDSDPGVEILDREGSQLSAADAQAFVRGEDLRTVVVPSGNASKVTIVSLPGTDHEKPRRIDARGASDITDKGTARDRFLVAMPPSSDGFFLTFDRPAIIDPSITRETIEVVTEKTIPVEEIVRRHQAYWSNQEATQPRYLAYNETTLRFPVSTGDAIEATIAGNHFFDRAGISDWVWENLYINGVKWKYGSIPELPLVQPEKVAQLPLEIHLTNEYRYELVRRTIRRGYNVWEVAFRPPDNAPEGLPLYRGRVWIDTETYARIEIAMIQLNLTGEVLSNEEHIEYVPFDRSTHEALDPAASEATLPSTLLWLPREVNAQQVLSMVGATTAIIRETRFSQFQIDPDDFGAQHSSAKTSRYRMVRDTDKGLRYLVPDNKGDRVVKDAFDKSRLFLIGGLHHDDGLEYGVIPLGGIDYFNFDLFDRGWQANVFFAGVITVANLADPSAFGTRANLGIDFFGLAIPFENSSYRNGQEVVEEAVDTRPLSLNLKGGYPVGEFGKVDLTLSATHVTFSRSKDAAEDFTIPVDTFVLAPVLSTSYDRWGYSLSGFYEYGTRADWEPWGVLSEYSDDQKDWTKWGLAFGKTFQLPKFQRIGVGLNWVDGKDLDRFSKYELGFFGGQRVRGIRSGSVRAEAALFGHLSYGFVISDFLRLESFYDIALVDDLTSGYDHEPFQGIGVGGQLVGPWGSLLRFEVGKSVGDNAQNGVVANVVFLKIFNR